MYLSYESIHSVLRKIKDHVQTFTLALDYLSNRLLNEAKHGDQKLGVVGAFEQLGAPFIRGIDDISQLADDVKYEVKDNQLLIEYMNQYYPECQLDAHLFQDYLVCTLAPK